MLRVRACSARNVGPNSVCRQIQQRRDKLIGILAQQQQIAKELTRSGHTTIEARCAWEIVEELSQKLDKLTKRLDECIIDEKMYYERMVQDDDLSRRVYDI